MYSPSKNSGEIILNKLQKITLVGIKSDLALGYRHKPDSLLNEKQIQKFIKRIKMDLLSDCWNWVGYLSKDGYARISINGIQSYGHRLSYQYWKGNIPNGLQLDHLCRNRKCVNPNHLECVTTQENIRRGFSIATINSLKTHCKRGHEYTVKNTWYRKDRTGRFCKKCWRDKK